MRNPRDGLQGREDRVEYLVGAAALVFGTQLVRSHLHPHPKRGHVGELDRVNHLLGAAALVFGTQMVRSRLHSQT